MSHAACSKPGVSDPTYTLDSEEPDNVHPGQPYLQRIVDVMAEDLSDVLNLKKAES